MRHARDADEAPDLDEIIRAHLDQERFLPLLAARLVLARLAAAEIPPAPRPDAETDVISPTPQRA